MKWLRENGWILYLIIMICAIFGVFFLFFGNPVSLFLANRGAEAYIQDTYAHLDLEITNVGYDFIRPGYYAHVTGETVADYFSLYLDGWGNVYFDTYG